MNIIINHDYRPDMTQDLPLEALAGMVLEHEEMPANTEVSVHVRRQRGDCAS